MKKSLVFYKGRAAKGVKTDWMMHEFRLPSLTDPSMPQKKPLEKTIPPNVSNLHPAIFVRSSSEFFIKHVCRRFIFENGNLKHKLQNANQIYIVLRKDQNIVNFNISDREKIAAFFITCRGSKYMYCYKCMI